MLLRLPPGNRRRRVQDAAKQSRAILQRPRDVQPTQQPGEHMHVRRALGFARSVQDVHQFLWRPKVRDTTDLQQPRNLEPRGQPVRVLLRLYPGNRRRRVRDAAKQPREILQWSWDVQP